MTTIYSRMAQPQGRPSTGAIVSVPGNGLIIVADCPAGGPLAGPAAQMAAEHVRQNVERNADILERFVRHPSDDLRDRIVEILDDGFNRASQEVHAFGRRRDGGLAVSVDAAILLGDDAFIAHVGVGRTHLVRRGLVHRVTIDHVELSEEQGDAPPQPQDDLDDEVSALLASPSRGVGLEKAVKPETLVMDLQPGDRIVITNRAPHFRMSDPEMRDLVAGRAVEDLVNALVDTASGLSPDLVVLAAAASRGDDAPQGPGAAAEERLAILAKMPLFAHCSKQELLAVASATRPRQAATNTVLVRQGSTGREMGLVVEGTLEILRDGNVIAELGPGSVYGEMSMLDQPQASATVRAKADAEVFVIQRDAFFALLKTDATFAVKVLWNMLLRLSSNLRTTSARLAELSGD